MPLSPNDSGSSQSQPITFTSRAADRIAKVVRKVEQGERDQLPAAQQGGILPQRVFRVAAYTATWATGSWQTVTFYNQTSTPNTVAAYNLYANVGLNTGVTAVECSIARNGTAWYLLNVNLTKQQGYAGNAIQLLGHSTASTQVMTWYSVTTCTAS